MRSTQQPGMTSPHVVSALARAKAASGEYAEKSEIDAAERALDDGLRNQALPSYDAYRADPSRGIALEEVRASINKRDG